MSHKEKFNPLMPHPQSLAVSPNTLDLVPEATQDVLDPSHPRREVSVIATTLSSSGCTSPDPYMNHLGVCGEIRVDNIVDDFKDDDDRYSAARVESQHSAEGSHHKDVVLEVEDEGCCGSMQRKARRRATKVCHVVNEFFTFTPMYRTVDEIEAMDVPNSCLVFSSTNPARLYCLRTIQYSAFQGFILLCILINSIILALDEPLVERTDTTKNFMSAMDYILTVVFVLEMIIKVIALGFVLHQGAYLRNAWNVLDFIIVITSVLVTFVDVGGNLSALRVVRVLRPLRSINRINKLKRLISGIFNALPAVADNFFLFIFILFIFAVGGLQIFLNSLSNRCYLEPPTEDLSAIAPPVNLTMLANVTFPQLVATEGRYCGGERVCGAADVQTSASSGIVAFNATCEVHRDVFYTRNLNFDNFFAAMLLTAKIMTADNWPDNMQELIDSAGYYKAVIYLVILITVGSFFCVNLFLAILTSSYGDTDGDEDGDISDTDDRQESDPYSPQEIMGYDEAVMININTSHLGRLKDTATQCEVEQEGAFLENQLDAIEREFCNIDEEETRKRVHVMLESRRRSFIRSPRGAPVVRLPSATFIGEVPRITSPPSALKKDLPLSSESQYPERVSRQSFMLASSKNGVNTSDLVSLEIIDGGLPLRRQRSANHSSRSATFPNLVGEDSFMGSAANLEPSQSLTERRESSHMLELPNLKEPYTNIFTENIKLSLIRTYHRQRRNELQQQRAIEGGPSVQAQQEAIAEAEDELIDTSDEGSDGDSATTNATGVADGASFSSTSKTKSSSLSTKASIKRRLRRERQNQDDRAQWRRNLGSFIDSTPTLVFMTFITVLNIALLMADHYGIHGDVINAFNIIGIVCTCLFGVEVALKIVAQGFYKTIQNKLNALDLLLVFMSIPDMVVSGGSSAFSALRAIRLLRLLRLLKAFPSMQAVFASAARSVVGSGYLVMLIGLFLFVYAILGMQLFGSFYGVSDADVRDSYGSFTSALLTSFIVVTGDDWTDKMRAAMRHSTTVLDDFVAVIYFVSLFMIGNYILINLFVAIIMDKLEEEYETMRQRRERLKRHKTSDVLILPTLILPNLAHSQDGRSGIRRDVSSEDIPKQSKKFSDEAEEDYNRWDQRLMRFIRWLLEYELVPCGDSKSLFIFAPDNIIRKGCRIVLGSRLFSIGLITLLVANVVFIAFEGQPPPLSTAVDNSEEVFCGIFIAEMVLNIIAYGLLLPGGVSKAEAILELHNERKLKAEEEDRLKEEEMRDLTLTHDALMRVTGSATSPLQGGNGGEDGGDEDAKAVKVSHLDSSQAALSHATSGAESAYISQVESGEFKMMDTAEYSGSWVTGPAYLRDWFNIVDAVVTITAFIGLFVPTFKIFRSLRTIRLLNNIESTRVVTIALIKAVSNVLHGLIVVLFLFIVFGVMGVQFFKGKFFQCNDPNVYLRDDCVGNFTSMVQGPLFSYPKVTERQFERLNLNFDNIGSSLVSIFVVAVGDGWSHIMYNGMDTTSEGDGLRFGASNYYAVFFVIAFMCTNFFALNMIVGILISYFSKMKRENDGSLILTPKQRLFLKARSAIEASMHDVDIDPANNPLSKAVFWFINYTLPQPESCISDTNEEGRSDGHRKCRDVSFAILRFFSRQSVFDYVIILVVIINAVFIATVSTVMTQTHRDLLEMVNFVALIIYSLEALVKMVAYFPAQYFLVAWNVFDFLIVVIGWVDYALPGIPTVGFLRVLRVSKLLRGTGVQRLLTTILLSARSFVNVTLLFVLNLFIFAAAGVVLFKDVRLNGVLTESTNFRTVPNALLLLFQIVTTESWPDVMLATHLSPPDCSPTGEDCGTSGANVAFFLLFMVFGNFVTLQLFVAVIVETFEEATEDDANADDDDPEDIGFGQDSPADILKAFRELRGIWVERFGKNQHRVSVAEFVALLPYLPVALTMSVEEMKPPYEQQGESAPDNMGAAIRLSGAQRLRFSQNLLKETPFLIRFLASLALPVDSEGMLQYRDVVYSLAYRKFNIDVRTYANMLHTAIFVFQASFNAAEEYCTRMIQKRWRVYLLTKNRSRQTPPREQE